MQLFIVSFLYILKFIKNLKLRLTNLINNFQDILSLEKNIEVNIFFNFFE